MTLIPVIELFVDQFLLNDLTLRRREVRRGEGAISKKITVKWPQKTILV